MRKFRFIALVFTLLFCGFLSNPTRGEVGKITPIKNSDARAIYARSTVIISTHSVVLTPYSTSCNDSCDGAIKAVVSGGVGPFGYDWIGVTSAQGNGTDSIFDICNGNFTVVVTDSGDGNSFIVSSINVLEPGAIGHIFFPVTAETSCFGLCDGATTAIATGGNGGYSYLWSNGETTPSAVSLCTGDNIITTTDILGCMGTDTINIGSPAPFLANVTGTDRSCGGGVNDGTVTAAPTGGTVTGPYVYSWDSGPTPTSASQSGLAIGTYCVTVTDDNLCTALGCYTVISPPSLTLTMDSVNESCGGLCNGSTIAIVGGGNGVYAYLWSDGQTTSTATGLCVGMWIVTVTDGNSCQIIDSVQVGSPPPLTLTVNNNDVLCFGDPTGSADAIVGGGTPGVAGYTYAWDTGPVQTTATAIGLIAGTYCVTVTDSLLCTISGCVTIGEPTLLSVTAVGTNATCDGVCDATATATPSGGTLPYAFLWDDDFSQTNVVAVSICAPDTVTVTLTDGNGCTDTASVILTEPPVLASTTVKTDESCNGACDGTGTVTPTGGTGPGTYSFLWCSGSTGPTQTGLCAGTCFVTVTDGNGCTTVDSVVLIAPPILTVTATSTAASCGGVCDGSAEAFPVGGTGAISYSWDTSPVQTTKIATGLCAGVFNVTVTDGNGCTSSTSTTVTEPVVLTISMDSTLITCNGFSDGTATANPGGGTGGYVYVWSTVPVQTNQTATGLAPGTWCVTVTDGIGCQISACIIQVDPPLLTVATSKTDILCNGQCNGTATAAPGGGAPPYAYAWDTTPIQTTAIATGLCSGVVNVTITDANGCTVTGAETINEPSVILANATTTPSTCGNADGGACLAPSGGTPCGPPTPYGINWYNIPAFTSCITLKAAGTYEYTITDCNGCVDSGAVFITDIASHSVVMSDTNVTCKSACDGIGEGVVSGGTAPYNYQWLDGLGAPIPGETIPVILNLCPGLYILRVGDFLGCTIFDSITITEPDSLFANLTSVDVLCNGDANGSASTVPSGGTPPYSWIWQTGATSSTISGLIAGSYADTLTDDNGCQRIESVVVQSQLILSLTTDTVHVLCNGDATGQGIAIPAGGVGSYVYSWDTTPVQTDSIATGLIAGTYCVTVTDGNACTNTACVEVLEPPVLTLGLSKVDETCFGICNGTATATAGGGNGLYTYLWSDGQTTPIATGLCSGPMCVTVTDNNGCSISACITLSSPLLLSTTMANSNVLCNGDSNATGTATPAGGTLPYTFAWDNTPGFDTGPLADTLPAGTWHVTITDNQGCSIIDSVIVTQPNALLLTTDSIDILCNGLCTGVADVNTTGGTLPYTFLWDPGASNQTDSTATGLCAGTFSVTVNDINGCTNDTVVTIDEPAATLPNFAIADATCGLCDGEASSTPTGGAGTFTFNWYDTFNPSPPGNDTIFNQCAGFRNLELTDANGCIDTFTVGINNFGAPIIDSIDSVAVTCFDSCNGVATVHVQPGSGTGALTYTWTDGPPASTDTIADSLCAGVYFVQVEDALGCIVVGSTTITSPTDIVSLISGVNVLCFGDNDGEARTAPFGGVAGYTHLWTPGGGTTDTITGLVAGTYIDTITDFSGCFIVDTIVITEPPVFNVSLVDSTNITCFGVCNGTITVTSTGGTGLYTYAWNTVPLQITPVATGICAGVPTKVVVTDGQGCQDSLTVTLSEPTDLTSSITDSNNISCFGLNNGTATVTPVGGTAPYTYAWNNSPDFDTDSLADSLFSDTVYCVAITDSLGCQDTTCVTLSQPATLTANITDSTNISCNGLCNGDATVTAAGGSGTYTYSWDNAPGNDSTILADTLCAGVLYHITVTDSLGCQASDSITLAEPTSLTVVISDSSNISCNGVCDGTAVGFAAGGSAPYTYNWSPGGQTNDSITGLCAGTIDTLIVTDSLLCSDTVMVTLSEPAVLTITVFDSVNATCFGVCDGIGRTITAGGVAPYTYTWSLSADTLDSAIALCADTMNIVTVTDSNGCIAMDSVMLSQPLEIFATITDSTDATCFGVCDGQAVLTVAGGNAPLSLMWCNGELGDTAFALCADSILCGVVVDSLGCTDTASFTISQPTQVAITFTDSTGALCNGGCEGDATISVTGGTPPYLITWSNGDSGVFADSLCAGYAIVTVTDSIGCISIDSINILAPSLFAVDTVSTTAASCDSLCDAMAVVFGTGGTTPYTFIWSDSLTVNDTAINLCASTYIVTGIDSNGCTSIDTVVIVGPAGLTISVDTLTTISCFGGSDGAATVVATGGVGTHTFSWVDTSATPPTFAGPGPNDTTVTGLFAGIYFATVEDANGCIATVPVIINEPAPLQANVCAVNNVTCNLSCDGSAQVCPIGGTPIYTFQWDDPLGQTDSIAIDLCSGSYAVTVTDGNGCIALDSLIIIDQPDLLSCTFFDVLNTGCGVDSANGGAEAIGNGGTPPYNYLWNTTPANNTDSVGNLLAGNYNVLVTDANGCTSVCGISITDTSNMAAAITDSSMVTCNGACDGSAVVTATGSTPPYIATWVDFDSIPIGQINDTASGLCGGLYRVIVKSAAGCFRSLPILITQPDTLVAAIADTLSPLCNADSNGRLVVSQTGGTGPYTYQWFDSSGTSIGTSDTLDSIPAGPYCILVTDSNGCQDSICVVLTEPAQLFVSVINTVNPACSNTCDGMVVASAVGGTQPYAFLWLPDSIVNDSLIGVCVDTFVVTVTDTNSCFAADTVILSPIVTVTANAGADNTFCEGELVTIVGSGGTSYEWFVNSVFAGNSISTNDTLITSPSSSGWLTYILVVDDSICSDTDSVAVFIIPVAVDVCCDATIALGECIGLTGVATNGLIYSWSPGITLDDSTIFNPEACPMVSVTYVLTATNDSGCVGTDSLRILVQPDIPDGFTPQGDAYNEVWEIALLDSYPKASVQVYNRWGQLVFDSPEGNQYATKFDGTHNGKDLPVGTYYYVINLNDGITDALTGPITIMR